MNNIQPNSKCKWGFQPIMFSAIQIELQIADESCFV